jgi:hypothetical protein
MDITPVIGAFEGDDALLQQLQDVLRKKSLDAFDTAEQLLADICGLPYSARVAAVSSLAKASTAEGVARMIAAIREPVKEDSGGGSVTDSEDDEMVVIFAAEQSVSTNIDYDKRQLALHIAAATKDSKALLQEVDFPKRTVQDLALKQACRVASDQDILSRLLSGDDQGMNAKNKERMLSSCVSQRRVAVLDKALPALQRAHMDISAWLHGASGQTVKELLPLNEKSGRLNWKKLWQFHSTVLLGIFRTSLQTSEQGCLDQGRWELAAPSPLAFISWAREHDKEDTVFELFTERPSYTFASGLPFDEKEALKRNPRDVVPSEHPKKLVLVVSGFVKNTLVPKLSLGKLISALTSLGTSEQVRQLAAVLIDAIPQALRKCSSAEAPQAFADLLALLKRFTATADLRDVFGGEVKPGEELSWEFPRACGLIQTLLRSQRGEKRRGRTLSAAQMVELLAIVRELCEKYKPSCALFGVPSGNANGMMISLIVAESVVNARLTQWAQLLVQPCTHVLGPLCHRWMHAKHAGRDTSGIDAALTTAIEHIQWVSEVIEGAGLQKVWELIGKLPAAFREGLLQVLVNIRKEVPENFSNNDWKLFKPWPSNGRYPPVVHTAVVTLIGHEFDLIRQWKRDMVSKAAASSNATTVKEAQAVDKQAYTKLQSTARAMSFLDHYPNSLLTDLVSLCANELNNVLIQAKSYPRKADELSSKHAKYMGDQVLHKVLMASLRREEKRVGDDAQGVHWDDLQQEPLGADTFEQCWKLYCSMRHHAVKSADVPTRSHELYGHGEYFKVGPLPLMAACIMHNRSPPAPHLLLCSALAMPHVVSMLCSFVPIALEGARNVSLPGVATRGRACKYA